MSKHASPLLGYNNNVRHKNRVFHIQTEDSGVKHPHIITHLFMDGGRILKSVKRSYAEHVGADGMQVTVKQMMKEQHKAMFIALRDGQFDHLLDAGSSSAANAAANAAAANNAAAKDAAKEKAAEREAAKKDAKDGDAKEAKKGSPAPPTAQPKIEAPASAAAAVIVTRTDPAPPPSAAVALPSQSSDDVEMVPMTTRNPELTLDIDALERATHADQSVMRSQGDLPPPPANLFREKSAAGAYSSVPPAPPPKPAANASGTKKPPSTPPGKKAPSSPPKNKQPASEGRYAAARPAAIFGQARPQQGSSIFGEDLISDKSLDEVILSYLAEDLEPTADKKK